MGGRWQGDDEPFGLVDWLWTGSCALLIAYTTAAQVWQFLIWLAGFLG